MKWIKPRDQDLDSLSCIYALLALLELVNIKSATKQADVIYSFKDEFCDDCREHEDNCECYSDNNRDYIDEDEAYDRWKDEQLDKALGKSE